MLARRFRISSLKIAPSLAPTLIAFGLAQLAAGVYWPLIPVVSAMALIALGATIATVERLRSSQVQAAVLLTHAAIYGGLYALFFGASLDVAARGEGILPLTSLDLAASIPLAGAALRIVTGAMRDLRVTEY